MYSEPEYYEQEPDWKTLYLDLAYRIQEYNYLMEKRQYDIQCSGNTTDKLFGPMGPNLYDDADKNWF